MKRMLLLSVLGMLIAACGPLPVKVNLLPPLEDAGLAEGSFNATLDVEPGTDLSTKNNLEIDIPDSDGLTLNFPAPELPMPPVGLIFDFRASVNYAFDRCVSGLKGSLKATGYLSPKAPPWDSPLVGLTAEVRLGESGSFVLENRVNLTQAQVDAILSGKATIGIRAQLTELEGKTGEDCRPKVSGTYKIERAIVEARFF